MLTLKDKEITDLIDQVRTAANKVFNGFYFIEQVFPLTIKTVSDLLLVGVFRQIFTMSNFESALVQFAYYGAYFSLAIPAAFINRKFGYKAGVPGSTARNDDDTLRICEFVFEYREQEGAEKKLPPMSEMA
mgnify:CR=1 FL=1